MLPMSRRLNSPDATFQAVAQGCTLHDGFPHDVSPQIGNSRDLVGLASSELGWSVTAIAEPTGHRLNPGKRKCCGRWSTVIIGGCLLLAGPLVDRCLAQLTDVWTPPEERLRQLKPDQPVAYRDLAEELSVVEGSSRARDLTVRLYLISAAHAEGAVRRSALRGLIAAARSGEERRKLVLLAYQLDPQFSDRLIALNEPSEPADDPAGDTDPLARERLLDALQSLRTGKFARARNTMNDPAVRNLMARHYPGFSVQEFNRICDSGQVTDGVLVKTLEVEWTLRDHPPVTEPESPPDDLLRWREALSGSLLPRFPEISLKTVTEFDPGQSIYLNGIWKAPAR